MSPARRPPAPLAALLVAVAVLGTTWALVVPPWQAPDEPNHFAYAQVLAERFALPGETGRRPHSTAQDEASDVVNSDQVAAELRVKPEWSRAAWERWQERAERLPASARRDGGGANSAGPNPPLYYLAEAVPYRLAASRDPLTQLTLMRLGSVLCLLVTVAGAWLLAGEVVGRSRPLQLVAASVAGLTPMLTFISSSVNPDALVIAEWTLALWLGARVIRHGATLRASLALGLCLGLALITKGTSLALVPAALLALGLGLRRAGPPRGRLLAGAGALALAIGPLLVWTLISRSQHRAAFSQVTTGGSTGTNWGELASYVWQFYLPDLPFQTHVAALAPFPVYDVWVKTSWAAFGWLEIRFPSWTYVLFGALTMLVTGAAASRIWRGRRAIDRGRAAFFAVAAVVLLAGLHWTEYHQIRLTGQAVNQGRYLFPLVGLAGLAVAQAVRLVPVRRRGLAVGAVVGGLAALQILSLGLVAARFYA